MSEETNLGDLPVVKDLVRLSPKKVPFRRAGIAFVSLEPLIMAAALFEADQMLLLGDEPLIDVDISEDAGETWARFEVPDALRAEVERRRVPTERRAPPKRRS